MEPTKEHEFVGRTDRDCEMCGRPDRDPIHGGPPPARKLNEGDREIDRWRAAAGAHGVSVFEIRGGGGFYISPAPENANERWALFLRLKQVLAELLSERAAAARLEHENEELARGVLDLTRRLTIAEQRTKHAEELAERSMANASLWRRAGLEGERWRGAYFALSAEHGKALSDKGGAEDGHPLLPLAYFPAGEEPAARWGLTDLGQQAVDAGRVKGPEWTLLLSPDPREVLSIEVRRGSRQETTYRMAGYVTAEEPDFQGGHFLGLLEAFGEVARAQDEALGRAMAALEKLFLYGCQEKAAQWLERTQARVASMLDAMEERPAREDLDAVDLEHQAIEEAFGKWIKSRDHWPEGLREMLEKADPAHALVGSTPTTLAYDLAAICARCSRTYGDHILPLGPECDGFMAEAP